MKKRIAFLLFLVLAGLSMTFPAPAAAMDLTEEELEEMLGNGCSVENGTLTLFEGVETLGEYIGEPDPDNYREYADPDPEIQALFEGNPGTNLCFSAEWISISKVIWPSTIRRLGAQSFHVLHFPELTLPASLEHIYSDAFIYCGFDKLRIECVLPFDEIKAGLYDCTVNAYDVPESHPLYSTKDGVLYSKDRKKLIAYPNGRTDEHFDIPAGVECIGTGAFCNESLKTISLPIGLKTLEDYAFGSCTRLQAISVPLTVTQMGKDVFEGCISLERISLPPDMTTEKADVESYYYYQDDDLYRGDNGDTFGWKNENNQAVTSRNGEYVYNAAQFAWVRDGNEISVYADQNKHRISSLLPGGTPVCVLYSCADLCHVSDARSGQEIGWVATSQLDFSPENILFYMEAVPTEKLKEDHGEIWYGYITGPWIDFDDVGVFPLTEVLLHRDPVKGYGDNDLGITSDEDPLKRIPLLDTPDGTEITQLHVGTQIRILDEQYPWVHVSTGFEEGWLKKEYFRIVPVKDEGEEE